MRRLTEQPFHRQLEPFAERWTDEVHAIEGCLFEDSLRVAQRLETFMAVIGPHPTRTDTAERKIVLGVLQQSVVEGDAAGSGALQDLAAVMAVRAEMIEGQRPGPRIDVGDGIPDLVLRDQHLVWRDTSLPGIGKFALGDAVHRAFQWRAATDDRRRFAAQLERDRHQIVTGRPHHLAADRRAAGEQQVIERQV